MRLTPNLGCSHTMLFLLYKSGSYTSLLYFNCKGDLGSLFNSGFTLLVILKPCF